MIFSLIVYVLPLTLYILATFLGQPLKKFDTFESGNQGQPSRLRPSTFSSIQLYGEDKEPQFEFIYVYSFNKKNDNVICHGITTDTLISSLDITDEGDVVTTDENASDGQQHFMYFPRPPKDNDG